MNEALEESLGKLRELSADVVMHLGAGLMHVTQAQNGLDAGIPMLDEVADAGTAFESCAVILCDMEVLCQSLKAKMEEAQA